MMATARRNSAAASAGRPARCRARPTYEWLIASLFWKSVSVGLSVGQLLQDRPRPLVRRERLRRMAGLILDRADDLMALCQVALESSDGGVGVGQLLQDRPRLLERRERQGEMSGLLMQEADVVVALGQVALELSDRWDWPRPASD